MKRISLILVLLLGFSNAVAEKCLDSLADDVIQSIITLDSSKLSATMSEKFFDYFEGDTEINPKKVPENYYKLDTNGYFGKENGYFIKDKKKIIALFTKDSKEYPRARCPIKKIYFSKLAKISDIRYEIIISHFLDSYNTHLVFLKINGHWKLAGTFFEAGNATPCEKRP
jgi:hypothetical protein